VDRSITGSTVRRNRLFLPHCDVVEGTALPGFVYIYFRVYVVCVLVLCTYIHIVSWVEEYYCDMDNFTFLRAK
jgi:hypothetical protein